MIAKVRHRIRFAICAWIACFMGCASSSPTSRGADGAERYVLQFKSATLPARRPGGRPWHVQKSDGVVGGIAGFILGAAVGHPVAGMRMGSRSGRTSEPLAPRPYVVLKIDGRTYSISPTARTLNPKWQQPIMLSRQHSKEAIVLIQVMDAIDQSVLGQQEIVLGELVSKAGQTLVDVGAVASLDLEIGIAPVRRPSTIRLRVPSTAALSDLRSGRHEEWKAVPVWNGDKITITATGEVCPSHPTPCFDANGAPAGQWRSYNYGRLEDAPHASLVGLLPGEASFVGTSRALTAQQSGFLLLFVNDTDASNNSGAFDVTVLVEPEQ